ncbi:uncharacterized protein PAC_14184 [Phialocephala subalpina]|uniref:LEA domain protein n=1 Tax=Phialocephala subalpina TaxID=576137 RepID=A0A1L7XH60_9HELO|nr:uncharacterized protein PAC_14184 [Phialocephala subalpina]
MSFLLRTLPRQSTRAFAPSTIAPRAFSTSFVQRKSATETVKDAAKTVDRKVSDKLVDGIELGQTAAQKAKSAAGMSADEAKGKAAEMTGEAKGKAHELAGEAKGKKEEIKGKL